MQRTLAMNTAFRSRRKRRGFISVEWILLFTALVIGVIGGLVVARNAIVAELHETAEAIEALNFFP